MKAVFKEPLVAFFLLGGMLFILFQQVSDEPSSDRSEIIVTAAQIQALALGYEKVWRRLPDEKEMAGLIQNYIRDEVLYREALAMGLDQNDAIVRRRLRQKMTFISEDLIDVVAPEEQELQAYLNAHQSDYRQPSRFSFQHIYFNSSKRGKSAKADAIALLNTLQSEKGVDLAGLGDALMLQQTFNDATEWDIRRDFGIQFAQTLGTLPTGKWQGPVISGLGLHLVRIEQKVEAEPVKLDDVRTLVLRDWRVARRKQTNEAFYSSLRQRYKVILAPDS